MSNERYGRRGLKLERMEGRDVPAVSIPDPVNGVLTITSDAAADVVLVSGTGSQLLVTVNGETQAVSGTVQTISFVGGGGDDVFVNLTSLGGLTQGGAGNDILVAGSTGGILLGGDGDDILVGGAGNDILLGEAGQDVLFGGPGVDVIVGGTGRDLQFGGRDMNDGFNDGFNDGGGDDDEEDRPRRDNHGQRVSEVARDRDGDNGRNHGERVSNVARSNGRGGEDRDDDDDNDD